MKNLFCLFFGMFITCSLSAQYTIQLKHLPFFQKHKLAILSDTADSAGNAALTAVVKKYWKGYEAVVIQEENQAQELEKTGDYVFLRHSARIMQDNKGEFRTDFLDFYNNRWTGENMATCYTPKSSMASNALYIKFFLKVIQNSYLSHENNDSANLCRNGAELASLRNNILYIPASMFSTAGAGMAQSPTTCSQPRPAASRLTLGSYTFNYKLADDQLLGSLAKDDSHQVCVANLVTLPDHTTAFYIYDVNEGKVIYRSYQKEALISLAALQDLNMAIMKTRLQSSL